MDSRRKLHDTEDNLHWRYQHGDCANLSDGNYIKACDFGILEDSRRL